MRTEWRLVPSHQRVGWPGAVQTPRLPAGEETAEQAGRLAPLWCQKMFGAIRDHVARRTPPRADWHPDRDEEFWPAVGQEAADDATQKAAAVLRVPPIAVAIAARARWNGVWGLTGGREHRLAALLHALAFERDPPGLTRAEYHQWQFRDDQADAERLGATLSRPFQRRLQALRGHITRALIEEVRPLVDELRVKPRKRR